MVGATLDKGAKRLIHYVKEILGVEKGNEITAGEILEYIQTNEWPRKEFSSIVSQKVLNMYRANEVLAWACSLLSEDKIPDLSEIKGEIENKPHTHYSQEKYVEGKAFKLIIYLRTKLANERNVRIKNITNNDVLEFLKQRMSQKTYLEAFAFSPPNYLEAFAFSPPKMVKAGHIKKIAIKFLEKSISEAASKEREGQTGESKGDARLPDALRNKHTFMSLLARVARNDKEAVREANTLKTDYSAKFKVKCNSWGKENKFFENTVKMALKKLK